MPFDIQVTPRAAQDGVSSAVVKVSGFLDMESAPKASKVLDLLLATHPKVVVFDLDRLEFVDSTGISLLLSTQKTVEEKGGKVFLTHMQPGIRKIFDIVKVLPATALFRDMKEMDEYLKNIQKKVARKDRDGG